MLSKGFGGAERAYVDLCRALAEHGVEIQAICREGSTAHAMLADSPGITLAPVRLMSSSGLLARRNVQHLLRDFHPAAVHVHMARAAAIAGEAAKRTGQPVIAKLHNYIKFKYYQRVNWFNVTTLSQFNYLRDNDIPTNRIRLIPNFSSFPPRDPATSNLTVSPTTWVSIGRFVYKKGFDHLLRAFAALHADDLSAKLILAGDGQQAARLRALAIELGIKDSVEFPGWVTDVAPLLESASFFVLPSRDEPFGIAVLEAMASGIPIISTRTHGPSEILDDTTAFLCAVNDSDDLLRVMREVVEAPKDAYNRAINASELYRQRYHVDVVLPKLLALYQDMLSLDNAK
jgi:glycosyltransferase involved in cell wall biosynthesis